MVLWITLLRCSHIGHRILFSSVIIFLAHTAPVLLKPQGFVVSVLDEGELGGDSAQAETPPANLVLLCNGFSHCSLVLVGLHRESLVPRLQPGGNGNRQWREGLLLFQLLSQVRLQGSHLGLESKIQTAHHMLVVLQDALAQRTLTVLLPLSQLEHIAHAAEARGELAKELSLAQRKVGSSFLLAGPINVVNELGWDGVLLLPVFFELCPHYFIVEVLWVKLGQLLALEIDSERLTTEFVVWHRHSVTILVVLLGITACPDAEPDQGGGGRLCSPCLGVLSCAPSGW